jgi:hypothetical protein
MTPTIAAGFACTGCGVAIPTLLPENVTWSASKSTLSWDPVAGASFYSIYRGTPLDLPALLSPDVDACRRAVTSSTTAYALLEVPPEGTFYWYLVRAGNGAGEGEAGSATAGARTQDSSGECP